MSTIKETIQEVAVILSEMSEHAKIASSEIKMASECIDRLQLIRCSKESFESAE